MERSEGGRSRETEREVESWVQEGEICVTTYDRRDNLEA